MATSKEIRETPFAAAHPTEIIKDEIKARGMTQNELASRMGMQKTNLSRLLKGENITPAIAARLETALEIPARIWLNLQAQYEIDSRNIAARNEDEQAAINNEKMLSNMLNLPELYRRMHIDTASYIQDKLQQLEDLLGFPVLEIGSKGFALQACYKNNEKFMVDEKNQTTWLALAYIESRKNRPSETFVHGNASVAARQIAAKAHQGGLTENEIRTILDLKGISYSHVEKLDRTPIDAVSMIVDGYPSIITTHRYNDMSRLVFNILHELGHIHLHMDSAQNSVFVSSDCTYSRDNREEKEANKFAEDMLIPADTWKKIISGDPKSIAKNAIVRVLKDGAVKYSLNFNIVAWRYKYESEQYGLYGTKAQPIV